MPKKIKVRKPKKPRSTLVIDAIRRKGGKHKDKRDKRSKREKEWKEEVE
jgi:hypothetical protein